MQLLHLKTGSSKPTKANLERMEHDTNTSQRPAYLSLNEVLDTNSILTDDLIEKEQRRKCIVYTGLTIIVACVAVLVMYFTGVFTKHSSSDNYDNVCGNDACCIFCHGDLLHTVQLYNFYNDSKYFVDMALRANPNKIIHKWNELSENRKNDSEKVLNFINTYVARISSSTDPA